MLSSGQKAALDAIKIDINRHFHYERTHDGDDDADLTLEIENNQLHIHGMCQTIDELEYAAARLITAARKEVSHGKIQPTREMEGKS